MSDESWFKGFYADAGKIKLPSARTIEAKRQKVVDGIDAWVAVLKGGPKKGVKRLSIVQGGERRTWLKYGPENVPLTDEGHLSGIIDIEQDELVFWQWLKDQVLAGTYDAGIRQVASKVSSRMVEARTAQRSRSEASA